VPEDYLEPTRVVRPQALVQRLHQEALSVGCERGGQGPVTVPWVLLVEDAKDFLGVGLPHQ
jgi:hypothetical protein